MVAIATAALVENKALRLKATTTFTLQFTRGSMVDALIRDECG